MLDPPRRRLSLSDASILIAATALGLVMARYVVGLNLMAISPTPGDRAARIERIWMVTIHLASPMLVTLSLAAFAISLRRPRPPLRRLAREPGFVALAVIAMTTAYYSVHFAARLCGNYYSSPPLFSTHVLWMFANLFIELGWNVALAWFVLALQGNWSPRSIWAGGIGAALGCTWIAVRALHDLHQFFRLIYYNYF